VLLGDYLAPRFQPWDRVSELFFVVGPIGVGFLPWTLFLPSAVRHGWWSAEDEDVRRRFRFLLIWVVVYAVVITILPHKRERYLLPTYPVLAIMIGWLWDQWARRPAPSSLRKHGWAWAVLAIAMSLVVLLPPPVRLEPAVFYSQRSARAVRHPMEVEESLQDGGPVHLVADERWWRVVNDTTGRAWSVWDRTSFAGKAVVVASPGERP